MCRLQAVSKTNQGRALSESILFKKLPWFSKWTFSCLHGQWSTTTSNNCKKPDAKFHHRYLSRQQRDRPCPACFLPLPVSDGVSFTACLFFVQGFLTADPQRWASCIPQIPLYSIELAPTVSIRKFLLWDPALWSQLGATEKEFRRDSSLQESLEVLVSFWLTSVEYVCGLPYHPPVLSADEPE